MNHIRSPFALSAVALAATILVAACGGGDAEAPPAAGTSSTGTVGAADTVPPTLTISNGAAGATATGDVTFTFTFSEDVGISFTADKVTVAGGTKGTFLRVGTTQATLVVSPTANATGTVNVSVAAGAVKDLAGNANAAASTVSVAFNTVPPTCVTGGGAAAPAAGGTAVVTFDESTAPLLTDFGGEASSIVADPSTASNKVLKITKPLAANLWAGTTVSKGANQSVTTLPFAAAATKMTVRVCSPAVGIHVRLKVEDAADPTHSVETEAITTVANGWETLTFDFASPATGTAGLNLAYTYNKVSVFPDFGKGSDAAGNPLPADRTYYIDSINFSPAAATTGGSSTLLVSFDETTPATLTDFGGEASAIAADPVTAGNKVLKITKHVADNLWAGTTVSTGANQSLPKLPFSATATKMTLRAYSPAAGIHVRLKVEDAADPTHTVETEAITTATGTWETLTFDFASAATGTAALNPAFNYNKASIFPDFGKGSDAPGNPLPADRVYYFDDLSFLGASGGGTTTSSGPLTFSSGFGTTTTVEGGSYGGYSGSNIDGFNCGAPASCGNGGSFTPSVAASASGFYYYYQTPSPATALYAGIYVQAPGLTTGLSATADTKGLQVGSQTLMKFTFGQNPEWFATTTKNFAVILTLGKFYNVGSASAPAPCNIKLLAVVTPTASAASAYAVPLISFGLIQTCGVSGLTPTSALALAPVSQVDFQATGGTSALPAVGGKTAGANLSVSTGSPAVYPTTLVVNGGITFE
jgi:hypothetical protein